MFAERGYDSVRVGDVAAACGVSAKTLYSYFPTKESLLFERGTAMAEVLDAPYDDAKALVTAVMTAIREEIDQLATTAPISSSSTDPVRAVRGFVALAESTPSLRAAAAERSEALTQRAASAMSRLNGLAAGGPENQVAAAALMSLWRIHLNGLLHHDSSAGLAELRRSTMEDVERGGDLVRPMVTRIAAQASNRITEDVP